MNDPKRLEWSLLALRLGVFVVMLVWTLDKCWPRAWRCTCCAIMTGAGA